ncbi:MAG: hypothetical protein M1826_002937 [Phylliscum demangeonii]|nr:MAG: hypothetical protein M1826_002937 [Phylliscum demangeonii]
MVQQVLQASAAIFGAAAEWGTFIDKAHPLCRDPEGWGPLSSIRYDFTPCFLHVWIAIVAAYGVLFGAGAVWWLVKRRKPMPVSKDWHFYTKLMLLGALVVTTVVEAALQISAWGPDALQDFRWWTTVLTTASLIVIFSVQYLEHSRSRTPNGVVLFYWLLLLIVYGVKLRSLITRETYRDGLPYFVVFATGLGFATLEFLLEWLVPKKQSSYHALGDEDECPVEYATIFSKLSFSWMTPLMKRGYRQFLTEDDLWNLRSSDTARVTGEQFERAWQIELEKKQPSLWIAFFRAFGAPYLGAGVFKMGSDLLTFVQPQLLRALIRFIGSYQTHEPEPVIRGVAIALAMFVVAVTQTVLIHQYFQLGAETGMRVRASLATTIYAKALRLSNEGRAAKTTGDIVNYMAVDTERLQDLTQYAQMLWSAPLQLILCLFSLYQLIGWSMMAGLGAMVVLIPLNGVIAKMMKELQKRQMKNKDARSRLMSEILNNMKSIKLFAWSSAFMKKLRHIRNDQELVTLRKVGALQALANFTWNTTPFLVSCATFSVFVLTHDEPLTTELVFPALTLFNLLGFPLAMLPMIITAVVEATVSVTRLTGYLTAEEIQPDAVTRKEAAAQSHQDTVRIRNATFTWTRSSPNPTLKDITFSAKKGELCCVVGRVGAGKSSLLQSVLGDLWKICGEVVVHGSVAFVAQQTWIMNATVKDNIVFGYRWDPKFYELTVKACALLDDFQSLPDGDQTEVGERGISLSGGQKARLALARAVYARADVYLLDDVLSAVDQHVGRHLIENVLGPHGLLKGKTRILATNSIPVLAEADFIVLLQDGSIVERGSYRDLLSKSGEVAALVRTFSSRDEGPSEGADPSTEAESSTAVRSDPSVEESERKRESAEAQEDIHPLISVGSGGGGQRKTSFNTLRRASTASSRATRAKPTDDEEAKAVTRTTHEKEFSEQGKVKWKVYAEYAKTSNLTAVAVYLFMLVAAQTASVGGNLWLKQWSEANQDVGGNAHVGKYIGIYAAFGIGSSLLMVAQTMTLWIFCSIEASRKLHERMAIAIFRSPMSFFETTPAGRILNRFSRWGLTVALGSDIYRVDEVLARSFNMLFVNFFRSSFTLVVISTTTPLFILLILPLSVVYLVYQTYFLYASRELKRLDSTSRSPIYAHFQESLGGITTIRAYRQQKRFGRENEGRVDANLRAYFPSVSANRWLAIRLEFLGAVIILAAAGFAILNVATGQGLSAGMVGLAMSYALQITQSLNWIVRQSVEVETNIVSVERVLEYANLPSEAPDVIPRHRPAISWPAHGAVGFQNYSARYRPGLDLVLKNIQVQIKAHEKIGVVGRTGAGKSSLTLALFRLIEPAAGHISIDDVNTSTIGLLDLRRRLAIIPQDAALFEGTVRDNLDPGHVHDDTELWSVLEHARLKEHVSRMEGKLDAIVHEGGSNLSQGQRQLVSLARALLTPSNILVLDEATAAVDIQTDALLQATLRSTAFQHRTIITIAHRINTILDSDRIIVLDRGEVAECGTPSELVRGRGLFFELVKEAGLLDSVEVGGRAAGSGSGSA